MQKKKTDHLSNVLRIQYFLKIFVPFAAMFLLLGGGIALQQKKEWLNEIVLHETHLIDLQKRLFESAFLNHLSDAAMLADVAGSEFSLEDHSKDHAVRSLSLIFLANAQNRPAYDQVRYLDAQGQEIIRVNRKTEDEVFVVPPTHLQFKGDRYYFKKGMASGQSAYVSRFDLNVEHNQVERPFKPMIRLTYPVLTQDGDKKGLIVLNLLGQKLIDLLQTTGIDSNGQVYLVNDQGYWLKGPSREVEWQFMFHESAVASMGSAYPDEWRQMVDAAHGHIQSPAGLFTFAQVSPESMVRLFGDSISIITADENWLLVNLVPQIALKPGWWRTAMGVLTSGLVLICVLSYYLAVLLTRRKVDIWKLVENEKTLASITESVTDAIMMVDAAGRVTFWNPAAEKIFGISAGEIIGDDVQSTILPEEQRASAADCLESFSMTGECLLSGKSCEIEMLKKDGTHFPADLSLNTVYLDGSWWAVCVVRDITAKKEIEKELRLSREVLESRVAERTKELNNANLLLENKIEILKKTEAELQKLSLATEQSPSSVVILDLEHNIEYVNPSFTRITGYTEEETLGRNISILKSGKHEPGFYENLWSTVSSHNIWRGEICNRKKNGNLYWEMVRVSPVRNYNGGITHYVAVKDDITDHKQKEEELLQAKKEAELANQAKSDFLANMSHEIRTPLNAIIGMTHLALETQLNPKQQDYLTKIDISVQSLLGVINDILDFSKIEAGHMKLEETDFSLAVLLHRVRDIFSIKVIEKGLQFHLDVAADVPLLLRGDPLRLTQILNNLVGNAVKFTDKGQITLSVNCIDTTEHSVGLQFSVRDTGIGMDQSVKKNLFQAFTQADTSTTRKYGGTGLGLAITKELVAMQKGDIWVESRPGIGSEFFFMIDYGLTAPESSSIHEMLNELQILVVEDEDQIRYMLQRLMSMTGPKLLFARSSAEAITKLEEQPLHSAFHAYLVDWNLQEKTDGIELISRIKKHPKAGNQPKFILMSGYLDKEIEQAMDRGQIDLFLSKPLTSATLMEGFKKLFINETIKTVKEERVLSQNNENLHALKGARILLVEDNEINQQVAQELLQNRGIRVIIAGDGQQALDKLKTEKVDAVLMDIQMPVKDGYETTREIRGDKQFAGLPIIAMSAFAMESDHEKSFKAGMNDFVTKPFKIDELLSVLAKWIDPQQINPESTDMDPEFQDSDSNHSTDSSKDLMFAHDIPGVHILAALNNLEGNVELYHSLLVNFSNNFSTAAEDIENALLVKDYPLAHRLAHTVKGVAGNIGAKDLQMSAQALEKALRKEEVADSRKLFGGFESSLGVVIKGLRALLEQMDTKADNKDNAGDAEGLITMLEQLEIHVQKRGAGKCSEIMREILSKSWPEGIDEKITTLSGLLGKFRFREAEDLLLSLKKLLT
jgi:PAS domain S-box-containing protein